MVWRFANVSRFRTIFAAAPDSQDGFEAAPGLLVDRPLRQSFCPGQDGRERIVQLVRDAGNRLSERRQLLGLQQLMVEVARLILEPLPLADVPHQGLDAKLAPFAPGSA